MITDQDVEKLKQTFVTIEYFDEQIDKIIKEMVNILGEMEERINTNLIVKFAKQDLKFNMKFERIENRFKKYDELYRQADERFERMHNEMTQKFKENDDKFYRLLEKMNEQQTIIFGHEKRFQRVETKLFPTP